MVVRGEEWWDGNENYLEEEERKKYSYYKKNYLEEEERKKYSYYKKNDVS